MRRADGLRDGIVSDPVGCRFDPASLICAGEKRDGCLSRPPGVGHCGGGPATLDRFDMLGAVVDRVESQKPPQAIGATGHSWPGRSRPMCLYPSHAHYKGACDVEDAASFECVSTLPVPRLEGSRGRYLCLWSQWLIAGRAASV